MVEYNDFQADIKRKNKNYRYEPKIEFINEITTTSSPYEEYDRKITYTNRKGVEYSRI